VRNPLIPLVVLALASCGDDRRSGPLPAIAAVADPSVGERWAPVPSLEGREPVRPVPYPSGPGARFVFFGASWCRPCNATMLSDVALAARFDSRIPVGLAIHSEDEAAFVRSPMSRWFAGVPVWTEESTASIARACGVEGIPAACLVDGDRALWTGVPHDAEGVLEAYLAGRLDEAVRRRSNVRELGAIDAMSAADREAAIESARGFAEIENEVAWRLADGDSPTAAEIDFAVLLARDAVNATGALDFAILDTYAFALAKDGQRAAAARVGARVIAVCDALEARCRQERPRAEELMRAL
jgi:hypothetical protein